MTKLSVVIPTFNRRPTLQRTLEACFRLTTDLDVEFVIIDDGSTDDTSRYLEAMTASESRLRFLRIDNSGPGQARNLGAHQAKGDILLFMGDDSCPTSKEFFLTHARMHEHFPEKSLAVLGKMIWPQRKDYPVSFVMSLIQGDGCQQFGYAHMRPYARYDWRFFYTANVSLKRDCVTNWISDGFSPDFRCAAFEDGELAYRLAKKLGAFEILYAPTAVAEHDHPYNVDSFINRQISAGMMATVLVGKHPETAPLINVADLLLALKAPASRVDEIAQPDQVAVIEGIFAATRLIEGESNIGSVAWHTAFLNAVFELAYFKGFTLAFPDVTANRSAAYRYMLNSFDERLRKVLEIEHFPALAPLSHSRARTTLPRGEQVLGTKQRLRAHLSQYEWARRAYRWLRT